MNSLVNRLKVLNNFGINDNEELTPIERINRIKEFRGNMNYENYQSIFVETVNFLNNAESSLEDKNLIVLNIINLIRNFTVLEDNINNFPLEIQILYSSYMELKRIKQHFELSANSISNYDEIVSIVNNYLDYLNNENHKYLISNCPSLIENFNKTIFAYMEKENELGIKHKEYISTNLINQLNEQSMRL